MRNDRAAFDSGILQTVVLQLLSIGQLTCTLGHISRARVTTY